MDITKTNDAATIFRNFGKFTIRAITVSDNDAVRNLIFQVRTEIDAPKEYLEDTELNSIHTTYSGKKSVFIVLTFHQNVIGTVGILPLSGIPESGCELKKFYVARSWRGFGMGMELIKTCLVQAHKMGYRNCYLETDPLLQTAGNLYKRLGFKHMGADESIHLPPTRYNWHFKPLTESVTN